MMRLAAVALCALGSVNASTSVVLCSGDFLARQSACDTVAAEVRDLVPSENYGCTPAAEPGVLSALLREGSFKNWIPDQTDFNSKGEVMRLMSSLPQANTTIEVMFGDCNNAKSLPTLEADKQYAAVILLDNGAAEGSLALNAGTNDEPDRVEMKSRIMYVDYDLFTDASFRTFLQDEFMKCQGASVCEPRYNSRLIVKEASLIMSAYLGSVVKLPKVSSFHQH